MKPRNTSLHLAHLVVAICTFAAVCGACLGQGTIVYHNPTDHLMFSRGEATRLHDIDMNSDGTVDFVFRAYTSFSIYSATGNRSVAIPQGGLDFGSNSVPLDEAFAIGSLVPIPLSWQSSFQPGFPPGYWVGQTLHVFDSIGASGFWQPNLTGYLGVEFQIEDNLHYGWIRLSTLPFPTANGGTIHDWAYNSVPGQPILAGQVPEPATWALLVGGGLAFFALGRQRSRK